MAESPPETRCETRCAPTTGRALIRVSGPDRLSFLQGLVTNDVQRLASEGILYAALLNPQGKYLADFFLIAEPDSVLLDTAASLADDLEKRLNLYRLRAQVSLERLDLPVTRGLGPLPEGALADPRDPSLGWRLYGTALTLGTPPDWPALRVAALVPETGIELIPGESYILEHRFPALNGVDFRKGCYVGQEVTARMHHKTELRKGLVRVAISGQAAVGSPILTAEGKPAGTLFTQAGGQALAWLRHDRAEGELVADTASVIWEGAARRA